MATKSLYQLKQEGMKKKNPNTLTDADYYLRDKTEEAKAGYPNTIDMTPPAPKTTTKARTSVEGE